MRISFPKNLWSVLVNGALASFVLYFSMYAFRKPFSVATFEGMMLWGMDYKILLILAQVMGYMLSKFIGIRVISALKPNQRPLYLVAMILLAEVSLVVFSLLPSPYNFILFFFNGLSLGMIWGVVFSYLEGRKTTEILSIILCSSFIVSSGAVKSVGLWVMSTLSVSQFGMPAVTGALFLLPFFVSLWFLEKLPPPTTEDMVQRKKRKPMGPADRGKLVRQFLVPLIILVIFYLVLTALRDFRDNFSRELWDSIGFADNVGIYTYSEIPIAILVLVLLGFFGLIKNNYKAFVGIHLVSIFSCLLLGVATLMFQQGSLSPIYWMIAVGFGMYACYVPFNSIFFDRMIAAFRIDGNAGFLIYIADSFGYLGSMAVLLYKNFGQARISWLQFFIESIYILAILGVLVSVLSLLFFHRKFLRIKPHSEFNLASVNGGY